MKIIVKITKAAAFGAFAFIMAEIVSLVGRAALEFDLDKFNIFEDEEIAG